MQPYYPQQIYVQPPLPQPPAHQGYKMAAILLFVLGYFLKIAGILTIVFVIGWIPLLLGIGCDIAAFIFLCLI